MGVIFALDDGCRDRDQILCGRRYSKLIMPDGYQYPVHTAGSLELMPWLGELHVAGNEQRGWTLCRTKVE
jgi:hypothetical protein